MPLIRKPAGGPAAPPPAQDTRSVLDALAKGNDDERWAAARAASGLPGSVGPLSAALQNEPNARVREAIFTSLARIGTPESVEALLGFLRSDDAHVRTGALDALSAMKEAVWPSLPALLADSDNDVRILACELARSMPHAQAVSLFCGLLDSAPEANVCASAIEVLAEIGTPEAIPALERCGKRFEATPFIGFSIRIALDRIRAQRPDERA
jgi:HEAT repeat protein